MEDLEGLFSEPNGPAYEKREERVGPPLEYVREKIGNSLRTLHDLAGHARGIGSAEVERRVWNAFYYEIVAFLALSNMLALANDHDLVDRLLAHDSDEFDDWLRRIEAEGSVVG